MISHCLGDAWRRLAQIPREQHAEELALIPATCTHADCTTGMGCRAYIETMLAQEVFRRACEARGWLRRSYTTRPKVAGLIKTIAAKRGEAAAEELRLEMRTQWQRRADWLGAAR